MTSKVTSPWDADAARVLFAYELRSTISDALHADIVALMSMAYQKGQLFGAKSEREFPHREDMGR